MPLTSICQSVIFKFGARSIENPQSYLADPTTEEEFQQIQYRPSSLQISWSDYQIAYEAQKKKIGDIQLRDYRNMLLSKCDWIMTVDVFSKIQNKEEWITYRQSLRDLPGTVTSYEWRYDRIDISKINLPTKPSVIYTSS